MINPVIGGDRICARLMKAFEDDFVVIPCEGEYDGDEIACTGFDLQLQQVFEKFARPGQGQVVLLATLIQRCYEVGEEVSVSASDDSDGYGYRYDHWDRERETEVVWSERGDNKYVLVETINVFPRNPASADLCDLKLHVAEEEVLWEVNSPVWTFVSEEELEPDELRYQEHRAHVFVVTTELCLAERLVFENLYWI